MYSGRRDIGVHQLYTWLVLLISGVYGVLGLYCIYHEKAVFKIVANANVG